MMYNLDVKEDLEQILEHFFRQYTHKFSAKDVESIVEKKLGRYTFKKEKLYEHIESSPYVFQLTENKFITRAGAFTGKLFSIQPTAKEFENRILIPGDRCLPFVDAEMPSDELTFIFDGNQLEYKEAIFDSDEAIDKFMLYGEEYAPQYIAYDKANKDKNILKENYTLANTVALSGVDISPLIEECNLKVGESILCSVIDWDKGVIGVMPTKNTEDPFTVDIFDEKRIQWYEDFEKILLESFNQNGPCSSIEEQLTLVFFDNLNKLCVPYCGSIEDFILNRTKKIGISLFGVETRLWFKDKLPPAIGPWNNSYLTATTSAFEVAKTPYTIPYELNDQYILAYYHSKRNNYKELEKQDFEKIIQNIYPDNYDFDPGEKEYKLLELEVRHNFLKDKYNRFTDQEAGLVRPVALTLFKPVSILMHKVDNFGSKLEKFPQQELVILSQMYGHLIQMLDSCCDDIHIGNNSDEMLSSLDGMKWNFEDIRGPIYRAIKQYAQKSF